jgi:hypothetical protein
VAAAGDQPAPRSLLCRADVLAVVAARLDLAGHHSSHEPRTPIRAHLLGLIASILAGASLSLRPQRRLTRAGAGVGAARGLLRRARLLPVLATVIAGAEGRARTACEVGSLPGTALLGDVYDELNWDGDREPGEHAVRSRSLVASC